MIDPATASDDILAAADTAIAALIEVRTAYLHATNELKRPRKPTRQWWSSCRFFAKMPF